MSLMQKLLLIVSVIVVLWFSLPIMTSGSFNIGSFTGIAVGSIFFLYVIFQKRINKLIVKWAQHSVKRWIVWGAVAIVIIILGLVIIESICLVRAACKKPSPDSTVVVLGCRVYGEKPSLSLVERLDAAYKYLTEHKDAVCVLSGGQGNGEDISEAECMYRYLTNKGIEPSRLFKEESSTSTRENIEFSMNVIEENGLNPKIAIATSEYHEYRASKIAESMGVECAAVPAHTAIWLFPTYYVRELYAILYEWLD